MPHVQRHHFIALNGARANFVSTRHLGLGLMTALALTMGAASPSSALVLALLSSEANVSGSLTTPGDGWSDSDQSFDLAPAISVSESFGTNSSSNSFVNSSHAVAAERLRMSTRSTAGAGGDGASSTAQHDFTVRFSIDGPALYELKNGNSTGNFPVANATPEGGSASLVYELRAEGAPSPVFTWAAPTTNSAGIYVSGVLTPGTYLWTAVAVASAVGDSESGSQSAASIGNVTLEFEDAPTPVPTLAPLALAALVTALGAIGAARSRRD